MKRSRDCADALPDSISMDEAYTIRQLLQAYGETDDLQHMSLVFGRKVRGYFRKLHVPIYKLRIDDNGPTCVYYGDTLAIIHTIYHVWKEQKNV